jgi:hypothetical protein
MGNRPEPIDKTTGPRTPLIIDLQLVAISCMCIALVHTRTFASMELR